MSSKLQELGMILKIESIKQNTNVFALSKKTKINRIAITKILTGKGGKLNHVIALCDEFGMSINISKIQRNA